MGTPTGFYFRKAFLSVDGAREVLATNVQITATNRAGMRVTDAAVGQYDDTAPASVSLSWTVGVATRGGKDYLSWVVTPGQRFHALRFSTADGVLEASVAVNEVAETQPEDPSGHERTITARGIVTLWQPVRGS